MSAHVEVQVEVTTSGGPRDGETNAIPLGVLGWPPPTLLRGGFRGGNYVLASHTAVYAAGSDSGAAREAKYVWREPD